MHSPQKYSGKISIWLIDTTGISIPFSVEGNGNGLLVWFESKCTTKGMRSLNKPITNSTATYGFISVREFEGVGYCGGLLIVSHLGRPIEFHCSAPVVPNRAQQILYGQTYPTYLLCEQIGLALIQKAKVSPQLFLANQVELLALNSMISTPVVALGGAEKEKERALNADLISFDQQQLWYQPCLARDPELCLRTINSLLDGFTKTLTFDEPFERIEKAIEEAQAIAR
jgi:hypothetical protein